MQRISTTRAADAPTTAAHHLAKRPLLRSRQVGRHERVAQRKVERAAVLGRHVDQQVKEARRAGRQTVARHRWRRAQQRRVMLVHVHVHVYVRRRTCFPLLFVHAFQNDERGDAKIVFALQQKTRDVFKEKQKKWRTD